MEYKQFSMSMFASKEDLYKAKAEYYEGLAKYLDGKIVAVSKCHPHAAPFLLEEAINRTHFKP